MSDTVKITLLDDEHDTKAVTVTVNGKSTTVQRNVETDLHPSFVEALKNSGYRFTVAEPDGAGSAVGAGVGTATLAERDGPDDSHAKTGQVDKEFSPEGYQPAPDAVGAEEAPASPAAEPPSLNAGERTEEPTTTTQGTTSPAGDDFDAEAVINGPIHDVEPRLAALSADQLAKVIAAEKDREQPRKGVLDAIAKLQGDQASA